MIAQPQQMELDAIRELVKTLEAESTHIPTITITNRTWKLELASENKSVDIHEITVRANGKIISKRNPAEWYYYESIHSIDGGISDFFVGNAIHTWTEGANTVTFDNIGVVDGAVVYQATDAFNSSNYAPEKIAVKLSDFGLAASGDSININYSVTVETV